MFTADDLIFDSTKTAYSEEESATHSMVIKAVAPILIKECSISQNSLVCEIGAGPGILLSELKLNSGCLTYAYNLLPEDIKECSKRVDYSWTGEMHEVVGSGYITEDYDLVVLRHILEHSPFPLLVLRNLCYTMKGGSYVYIEVPAPDTWANHESNPNHYSVMGANMWKSLFNKALFSRIVRDWTIQVPIPQPTGETLTDIYYGFILEV